jgi:hypothetical protein
VECNIFCTTEYLITTAFTATNNLSGIAPTDMTSIVGLPGHYAISDVQGSTAGDPLSFKIIDVDVDGMVLNVYYCNDEGGGPVCTEI